MLSQWNMWLLILGLWVWTPHWVYRLLKNKILGHLGGSVGWVSDFGSGHDLTVCEFEPRIRLTAVSMEPASDPLFPSLSAPALFALSLSQNKKNMQKILENSRGRGHLDGSIGSMTQSRGCEFEPHVEYRDYLKIKSWGTWVAQSVKCQTLALVMISQFMSSSPTLGSALTV